MEISISNSNKLSDLISENLISESANNLPMICKNYGLSEGTIDEAFKSKSNYVYSRITHLKPDEIYKLASNMKGKFDNTELDDLMNKIDSENNEVIK